MRQLPPSSIRTYDCREAIQFEKLDIKKSFKSGFIDKIEKINYDRYIMQNSYKPPEIWDARIPDELK